MSDPITITIDPPLPCCTIAGGRTCGKPAMAATLYPFGGAMYILQPICRDCVAKLRQMYLSDEQKASKA